jgi:hypothetical protein
MSNSWKAYLLAVSLGAMWGLGVPKNIGAYLIGFLLIRTLRDAVLAHYMQRQQ